MLRTALAPTIAASAALLVACGDEVSPNEYASTVCAAFFEWTEEIRERRSDLARTMQSASSLEQRQSTAVELFDRVVDASDRLAEEVADAGTPDVASGERDARVIEHAMVVIKSTMELARSRMNEISADSPEEFATEAAGVAGDANPRDALEGLPGLDSQELEEAFREADACRQLQA